MNYSNKTMEIKKGGNFVLHGRPYYVDDVPALSWSNSAIEFDARCDRFTVFFAEYVCDVPVYFKIYVDEAEYKFGIIGKADKAIIENLEYKKHNIRIVRISEGGVKAFVNSVKIYGKNPDFFIPKQKNKLKLEFIGDSITCGFGDMAEVQRNEYATFEQDSTRAYAALTAKELDADIRTECISGQGVVHTCGDEVGTVFSRIFDFTARDIPGYECDGWIPDVFVLNAGTNDKRSHVSSEEFENAAYNLLCQIRKMYPDTPIIWMYGMMMHVYDEELKRVVKKFNKTDKNTYLLIVKDIYKCKNETGAVGHPNVNGHERGKKLLVKQIKTILDKKKQKKSGK